MIEAIQNEIKISRFIRSSSLKYILAPRWVFLYVQFIILVVLNYMEWSRHDLTHDFAGFAQAWSMIGSGHLNPYDTVFGFPYLSNHFELIMWPLSLLYPIFHSTFTLLVFQDLSTVGTEIVALLWLESALHKISAMGRKTNVLTWGSIASLLMCLNPWVYWANMWDFHFEQTGAFFAVLLIYLVFERRYFMAFVSWLLLLSTGDVSSTYAIGIFLVLLFVPKLNRLYIGSLFGLSLAYLLLVHHFHLDQGSVIYGSYGYLVGSQKNVSLITLFDGLVTHPLMIIRVLLKHWKDIYSNLAPEFFIGVLNPWSLGLTIAVIVENNLPLGSLFSAPGFQSSPVYAIVAVSSVLCIVRLGSMIKFRKTSVAVLTTLTMLCLANSALWLVVWAPHITTHWIRINKNSSMVLDKVSSDIPENAPVVASQGFSGSFATRSKLVSYAGETNIPIYHGENYFVLSTDQGIELASVQQTLSLVHRLLMSKNSKLIIHRCNIWYISYDNVGPTETLDYHVGGALPAWLFETSNGKRVLKEGTKRGYILDDGNGSGYVTYGDVMRVKPGEYEAVVSMENRRGVYIQVWNNDTHKELANLHTVSEEKESTIRVRFYVGNADQIDVYQGTSIFVTNVVKPPKNQENIELRVWSNSGNYVKVFWEKIEKINELP